MQEIVSTLVLRQISLFAIQIGEFRKTDRRGYAAASSRATSDITDGLSVA